MAHVVWILRFLIAWQYFRPISSQDRVLSRFAYALVGHTVELTFPIPYDNKNDAFHITQVDPPTKKRLLLFRHLDKGDQMHVEDEQYKDRVKAELTGLVLRVFLSEVVYRDHGVYRCTVYHFETPLKNCGIVLTILGKPYGPMIKVHGIPILGQGIRLTCKHFSSMQPAKATINYTVHWDILYDKIKSSKEGFIENYEFVIPKVLKRYSGTQFVCYTRDLISEYIGSLPQSDPSNRYYLKVQYGPEKENMSLEPKIEDEETIIRHSNEVLKVACNVECEPHCYVYWSHQPLNAEIFTNLSMRDSHILRINVNRHSPGTYLCTGYNMHGNASISFQLEVNYMQDVIISVNDVAEDIVEVLEKEPATLKCTTVADPLPVMTLKSASQILVSSGELSPEVSNDTDGSVNKKYTISNTIQSTECDSPTDYFCEAKQGNAVVEKNISLAILCNIVKAGIPGIDLKSEYIFEKDSNLAIDFVMKAFPVPKMTSITTSLKGTTKILEPGSDYYLQTRSRYNNKHYLTRFTYKSLQRLSLGDNGVVFTIEFQAGKFKKAFSFTVLVTFGGSTPIVTSPPPPTELVVTSAMESTSERTRTTTKRPSAPDEDEETRSWSMQVTPILVVAGVIVVLVVLAAFYFLVITSRNSLSSDPAARGIQILKRSSNKSIRSNRSAENVPSKTSSKYDV